MSVCCECCVLSGRGFCVGLITRREECYRVWCVSECDREASIMRRPWPARGCCVVGKENSINYLKHLKPTLAKFTLMMMLV
jgi:hypothetical protein